jgi:hypothetical protein
VRGVGLARHSTPPSSTEVNATTTTTPMTTTPQGPTPSESPSPSGTGNQRKRVRVHTNTAFPGGLAFESTGLMARSVTSPTRTYHSVEEFLDGLRRLRTNTGASFRQIEQQSGGHLPRATAQAMVAATRTSLPHREDQVELFVKGCGGSPFDEAMWVDQWRRLRSVAAGMRPLTEEELPGTRIQYEMVVSGPQQHPRQWGPLWPLHRRWMTSALRRRILRVFSWKRLLLWFGWTLAVAGVTAYLILNLTT